MASDISNTNGQVKRMHRLEKESVRHTARLPLPVPSMRLDPTARTSFRSNRILLPPSFVPLTVTQNQAEWRRSIDHGTACKIGDGSGNRAGQVGSQKHRHSRQFGKRCRLAPVIHRFHQ